MKKYKYLALLLSVSLLTGFGFQTTFTTTANAAVVNTVSTSYTTSDGLFKYSLSTGGNVTITQYLGQQTNVTIPQYINNKMVTSLSSKAFYGNTKIKYVNIPKLGTIGDAVFYNCTSLQEVKIHEDSRVLGVNVFKNCPIKKLTIDRSSPLANTEQVSPLTITNWTTAAQRLTGLNIANVTQKYYSNNQYTKNILTGYTYTISNNQLTIVRININTSKLTIPSTMEGFTVTALGPDAFACGPTLTTVTLPPTLTSIGANAIFKQSSVENIVIPEYTTCEDNYPLAESLEKLTISTDETNPATFDSETIENLVDTQYNMDTLYIGVVQIVNQDSGSVIVTYYPQ